MSQNLRFGWYIWLLLAIVCVTSGPWDEDARYFIVEHAPRMLGWGWFALLVVIGFTFLVFVTLWELKKGEGRLALLWNISIGAVFAWWAVRDLYANRINSFLGTLGAYIALCSLIFAVIVLWRRRRRGKLSTD